MQAFLLTCLLCLQTQFPCDSNKPLSFLEDPSCSQCLIGLSDHFNLTNSSNRSQPLDRSLGELPESSQSSISQELRENLEDLFVDMKAIVQDMKGNPDNIYGMINKLKNDMSQVLVAEKHDEAALDFPSQEGSLEKILERFSEFVDGNELLQRKLTTMQSIASNGEAGEKRDRLRQGDILMIGESLVSEDGRYRWNFELGTGDSVIYNEKGKEVKRTSNCFSKPIGSNIHMVMNHTLEMYWDIWHGKSANGACSYTIPEPCRNSNCFVWLNNDGFLRLFTSLGDAVDVYI